MNKEELDLIFLRQAYQFAGHFSTDPFVQNGAILVRDNKLISWGVNKFPTGVKETEERWKYPLKAYYPSHAEENSIVNAARKGISTDGSTMYCPWFACDRCAGMIINAGIVRVIGHSGPDIWHEPHRKYENGLPVKSRWDESIEHAIIKMQEAGLELIWLNDEIGDVSIKFRGKIVYP